MQHDWVTQRKAHEAVPPRLSITHLHQRARLETMWADLPTTRSYLINAKRREKYASISALYLEVAQIDICVPTGLVFNPCALHYQVLARPNLKLFIVFFYFFFLFYFYRSYDLARS
jgi:hypothetical protein